MGDDRKHGTRANGTTPEPPAGTAYEVARGAYAIAGQAVAAADRAEQIAIRADDRSVEIHTEVVQRLDNHERKQNGAMDALRRDMEAGFLSLGGKMPDSRARQPSQHDVEELQDRISQLEDAADEVRTSPGMQPPPQRDSERVKARVEEIVEHRMTAAELASYQRAGARGWQVALGVAITVLGGTIVYLLTHMH